MLLSILIPSRGRPDGLKKAIQSFHDCCPQDQFEVLVRLDADDPISEGIAFELERFGNVRAITGPRYMGYQSVGRFITELSRLSSGTWSFVFNDDATIQGNLCHQLRSIPLIGYIAQPDHVNLNESVYRMNEGGAFPIVPNRCWEQFGWSELHNPYDVEIDRLLRIKHGWQTHFLSGVIVTHDRKVDQTLTKERF